MGPKNTPSSAAFAAALSLSRVKVVSATRVVPIGVSGSADGEGTAREARCRNNLRVALAVLVLLAAAAGLGYGIYWWWASERADSAEPRAVPALPPPVGKPEPPAYAHPLAHPALPESATRPPPCMPPSPLPAQPPFAPDTPVLRLSDCGLVFDGVRVSLVSNGVCQDGGEGSAVPSESPEACSYGHDYPDCPARAALGPV